MTPQPLRYRTYFRDGSLPTQHQQTDHQASSLRIVSHNAFWYQGHPFYGDLPGEPEPGILARLVTVYRGLNPDLLCLQEIQSPEVAASIAAQLRMAHVFAKGDGYPQYGGAVLSRYPIRVGEDQADRPSIDRLLLQVVVEAPGYTLRISNVHLPSNRFRGPEGGAAKRRAEVPLTIEAAGHPVDIVLGDINEGAGGPCGHWLSEQSYSESAPLCGAHGEPSSLGGMRGDQIWLHSAIVPLLQAYIVVPKEAFLADVTGKEHLSDHLPVGVDLTCGT